MKVSRRSKNSNFKEIKLKNVYVEIERLKWSSVMKKRFWKKHRLLRPCVSRICRQLLNIELQKRKNERKCLSKEQNGSPVNKKGVVKNTKNIYKKEGFADDDILTNEPPKKKLKFTNDDYGSGSDSESQSLEEKPPDTKDKILINTNNPQITEAAQVNGNNNVIPITKNSAKPLDKNSLTLYTKSGVKVLVMKSVTVPKSKVSNKSSLQKGVHREQSLVNSSVEPLSNDCNINRKDRIKNSCSADLNNKLDEIIEDKNTLEIVKEEIDDIDDVKNHEKLKIENKPLKQSQLDDLKNEESEIVKEEIDDIDNVKNHEKLKIENKPLKQRQLDDLKNEESEIVKEEIDDVKNHEKLKIENKPLEQSQLDDLKNEESEIDSGKESVTDVEKCESNKGSDIERTESDEESVNEIDRNETDEESVQETDGESVDEADRNKSDEESVQETDGESVDEADRNKSDEESVSEVSRNDFDEDEDSRIDDDHSTQSNDASDIESLPEFDPSKFLTCAIKTDDEEDPENQNNNKKVPFIKSQNFQLNCDTMVLIKPLLPEIINSEFCYKNQLKFTSAFRIRRELGMMTFMGQYGTKNHYVHLPEFKTSNFNEDYEDARPFPVVDPFTHSVFAPIIKRDRLKDKKFNRSFLRRFRTSLSKLNPSLNSQLNAEMMKTSINVYNNGKPFSRPSENPTYTPQPNMPNFPPNALIINANTIKIGDNFFSRVYDNRKPTQMFRPVNSSLNPGFAHQPRISRITICPPNVVSSNNVPINTNRFIYTASPSDGMPRLIPVIQSQKPMNSPIPIQGTMSNSQYSTIPPPGNNVSLNSGLTNNSDPLHINFGDPTALRPMPYVPLNTYNHTGPGLTNGTNSSTYPHIQNGKFQNPEVMPCHISPANPQCITVNNNLNVVTTVSNNNNNSSSNRGPPPHNFCVPGIINHGTFTAAAAANFPSKPQHDNVNTSMTLSDKVSNLGNTSNDEFVRKSVIVNHHFVNPTLPLSSQPSSNINPHPVNPTLHSSSQSSAYVVNHSTVSPPLPLSSQNSVNASSQTDEALKNQCESVTFFQWLHELKNTGTRCGSGCSFGSKTIFFNMYAKYVKALISGGFPNTFSAATNVVYQLLIAVNSYCSYHAQLVMNDPEYLKNLRTLCNISDEGRNFGKFFGLHLPYISPLISNPVYSSSFNLFILKRFVFIVEKKSRTVLCPLPAACKFQDSDIFDKITVLILMSPKFGLGPGLIIFPHSILGSDILLSLGLKGPLFETWTISAHPKGGLTQSMMTEFLNGPSLSWIHSKKTYEDTYLAVDWWLSLEDQLIDNIYGAFHYIRLHKMFPLGKDPFDICISVYMERIWGLIVKMWSSSHNDVKLKEHCFPKFIYEVFNRLCDPKRLISWCEESGLYPHNPNVTESFLSRASNMYE